MTEFVFNDLNYVKEGNGKAMLLLHGFPANASLWNSIIKDLSSQFLVVVPDLPGSGKSKLEGKLSLLQMAEKVKSITDHENIDELVVVGHSMGGYVALAFASLYPGVVKGLSLVHSTPEADDEAKKQLRREGIRKVLNGGKIEFIQNMVPNLFSVDFKQQHPEIVQTQIANGLYLNELAIENFYEAMMNRVDYSKLLVNATFPVQWIFGLQDNIINYKKLLHLVNQSDISFVNCYPDCAHMSMIETPDKLRHDLLNFAGYSFQNR